MPRPYYILLVRSEGSWGIEFGDYDREAVQFERDDYRFGSQGFKSVDLKIVRCADAREITIRNRLRELGYIVPTDSRSEKPKI